MKQFAKITSVLLLGGIVSYSNPAYGFVFSLDSSSSSIDGNITPDDILTNNLTVVTQGTNLGLQDDFFGGTFDILNAISYGQDSLSNSAFTVDRLSPGLPGTSVQQQALIGEQGGSIFTTSFSGDNKLLNDPASLGITPGFSGDALNSLAPEATGSSVYFSIDAFSATNNFGTAGLSSDILISNGTGSFSTFADGSILGLDDADDIDSLAVIDRGTIGQVDPGIDLAIFSLSSFSPSSLTFTGNPYEPGVKGSLSPADLLVSGFSGFFTLLTANVKSSDFVTNDSSTLQAINNTSDGCGAASNRGQDSMDGNTDGGTGGCKVPEPSSTLSLLALGTLGLAYTVKRKLKSNHEKELGKV